MPVVMKRPPAFDRTPVLTRGLALAAMLLMLPALPGAAQTARDLPQSPTRPQQRAPLPVPATPNLDLPPLPPPPEDAGVPPAPVAELPPPRVGGVRSDPSALPPPTSLAYAPGDEGLPAGADSVLADIARHLAAHPGARLEVRAHATGPADRANDARRTALMRARALRDRLVTAGIDPLRLLIFADGTPVPADGPAPAVAAPASPDRVDLVFRP